MKATISTQPGLIATKLDDEDTIRSTSEANTGLIATKLDSQDDIQVKQKGFMGPPGPAGPPGINWRGDYDPGTEYDTNDAVGWDGGSYIFIGTDPATGITPSNDLYWDTISESGAGGAGNYVRPTPMGIDVGGATVGTTFDGTVTDALDTILYPYLDPAFTSFSLSGYSTLEVGDEIPTGNKTFTFDISNDSNVAPNTVDIENVSDAITYVTGSANDNTETVNFIANVIRNTPGNKQFRITATNTLAADFNRTYNVNWYYRVYYGESVSPTLTENDIEALRANLLSGSANRTYAMNGGGYKFMCWATNLGTKSNFFDVDTGFAVAMEPPVTINITNPYGVSQDYYVYRTTNQLVGSINIQVS